MTTYVQHRFRWAACQIDVLSGCINLSKLREALDSLPTTLDEPCDRILCEIEKRDQADVLQILQWLTRSLRPLSLEEVAELIALDVDKDEVFDCNKRAPDPDDVLELCSSLVTCIDTKKTHADAGDGDDSSDVDSPATTKRKVRLAHFSVKEYLVLDRIRAGSAAYFGIDETFSHARIGRTSLSYLLLYDEASHTDSKGFSIDLPLAEYAAEYWAKHLVKGCKHVPHVAVDLLSSKEKMRIWIDIHDLEIEYSTGSKDPELPGSPLYYAVLTGLGNFVRLLVDVNEGKSQQRPIDDGLDIKGQETVQNLPTSHIQEFLNTTGGRLHTPLQAAAWIGQHDIAESLLELGADPNVDGGCEGGSALSAAAHQGYSSILELLLNRGADVCEGLYTNLEDLHDMGLDENDVYNVYGRFVNPSFDVFDRRTKAQCKKTALFGAASCGNQEIINLLIDRGAMVNIRNGEEGRTALFEACDHQYKDIVRSLLGQGAFVDKTDRRGRTPLLQASMSRGADSDETVRLLLEAGADVKRLNPSTGSALRAATVKGLESIVRLLLDYGPDVNQVSVLMEALRRGHTRIARLLVQNGANVNLMEYFDNGVPLWLHQRPVTNCIAETLRSIRNINWLCLWPGHEIESEEEFNSGWTETPLWIAAALGDIESVNLLLENGANLTFRNPLVHMTALDIATYEEHEEVINLLTAAMDRQVIDPEGSEDEDDLRDGWIDNGSLSPRYSEVPRSQRSASEATSDDRSTQGTKEHANTEHEDMTQRELSASNQDADSDDKSSQSPESPIPTSAFNGRPFIWKVQGKELRAYRLDGLLRKVKGESKKAKGRSWRAFGDLPMNTFLQRPDLSRLTLW